MNILQPLKLKSVETKRVDLVPTKDFFKAVVVIEAPVDEDSAALFKAEYLFDSKGNPRPFDGSVIIPGELDKPAVTLKGAAAQLLLMAETIAKVTFYRAEKTGMRIRLRIHCPEDRNQFHQLLEFLADLNEEPYAIEVKDSQASLIIGRDDARWKPPVADAETGIFNPELAITHPFDAYRLMAAVQQLEVEGGFIAGWSLKTSFKDNEVAEGRALTSTLPVHDSESGALEWAAGELMHAAHRLTPGKGRESKSVEKLLDWLLELVPSLLNLPMPQEGDQDADGTTTN